ncbi:MAG: peptidoglycan editing factor PgeF [Pseudomonadota bacterium]
MPAGGDVREVVTLHHPAMSRLEGLAHAVFTRHGGLSASPYHTLNAGYNTGDNSKNVAMNLSIIQECMGALDCKFVNQVHGRDVQILKGGDAGPPKGVVDADALISDVPHWALVVKLADCQGVMLFDPVKKVVSNVHCGWRGNRLNILGRVVALMKSEFACRARDIRSAIGPSLGPCCAEFIDYKSLFPEDFRHFMVRENHFDLWAISRAQLLESGLLKENIEVAGICTRCRTDLFYSYRGEGVTGRFATAVMLKAPAEA